MSDESQSASPRSSYFQHTEHRDRHSSSGTFYTCNPSTPPHEFYQNSCCSTPSFRTPLSSFSHHQTYFVPTFSQNSSHELNYSQTSLGHHSIKAQCPEPYSDNPFLPLRELRHFRSTELLASTPSTPSIPSPLLTPLTASSLSSRRGVRKPPPSLGDGQAPGLISTVEATVPRAASFCDTSGTNFTDPVDAPRDSPIVDAFARTSESSHSNTSGLELPPTPLYNALSTIKFPPISTPSTTLQHQSFHTRQSLGGVPTRVVHRSSGVSERDFRFNRERRWATSSDAGSTLQTLFGLRLSEVGRRSANVCESPRGNEIEGFAWDIEEQSVQVDGCGAVGFAAPVGKLEANTVESQILVDRDKKPTNEIALVPWINVSATSLPSTRKRPPPIRVENQGRRLTTVQIVTASPKDADQESAELKTSKRSTPPPISSTGEEGRVSSPRSLKLSNASAFSLSLFPPTPTTPIFKQTWIGENYRGQHDNQSPMTSRFSLGQRGLEAPIAHPMANLGVHLGSSPTLRTPSSPVRLNSYSRSAPTTPVRRSTIEIERRPSSELSHTSDRALFNHASSDLPVPQQMSTASTMPPRQVAHSEPPQQVYGPQAGPSRDFFPTGHPRSDTCSSGSESVYSQGSDDDTAPFYSDDGASVGVSVAAAALQEQEDSQLSGQSRSLYMRPTTLSSGRRRSLASHPSSTSELSPDDSKQAVSEEYFSSSESVPAIRVMPPTRKPVPQMDATPPVSGQCVSEPCLSLSKPSLPQKSPKSASFNALPARLRRKTKKRKPDKILISHPHLNDESMLGAEIVANRESVISPLMLGPKVTHSESVGSLRDVLLSGNPKRTSPGHSKPSNRHTKKSPKKQSHPPFEKYKMPGEEQLKLASDMCPLCQDYMSSIVHLTEPSFVWKAGVKLVIIGNGSPAMIKAYRDDVFHCPYEMYTDPSRQVYNALGMTLRTTDGGDESEKGSYVKHGTFTGTMMVLKNALKMPLANAGDVKQLGGEFILGPGLTCSFTSRMHTTRSHTPIRDLLQAAGVETNPWATGLSILRSSAEQARWMDAQNEDLDNMIRRGLKASCGEKYCGVGSGGDAKIGELDLSEFRRLLARLRSEVSKPRPERPPLTSGTSYEIEVMGQRRVELDHLGAVIESRNGSGTW